MTVEQFLPASRRATSGGLDSRFCRFLVSMSHRPSRHIRAVAGGLLGDVSCSLSLLNWRLPQRSGRILLDEWIRAHKYQTMSECLTYKEPIKRVSV